MFFEGVPKKEVGVGLSKYNCPGKPQSFFRLELGNVFMSCSGSWASVPHLLLESGATLLLSKRSERRNTLKLKMSGIGMFFSFLWQ